MIGHEIITASAGSGKTWSLTVRYIRLLALGAAPESVIALTFSRKAAGEFFTAILRRLAEAGMDDGKAAQLAEDTGIPGKTRADFAAMLATMVRAMPRLTLGTLDSFFVRIARSFPLELGLTSDFALLDDHQRRVEQGRVLARVFAPGTVKSSERRAFLEAFKQATWGKDEVKLREHLDKFIKDWHALFLTVPDAEHWGQPSRIWQGRAGLPVSSEKKDALYAAARRALAAVKLTDAQREKLSGLLDGLEFHTPGTPAHKDWKLTLSKCLELLPDLPHGSVEITINRKVELTPPFTGRLYEVLCRFVHETLMVCLHQTAGIHRLLSIYDSTYHEMVRRQGRLTFQDVQLFLSGDLGKGRWLRDGIDYRLDARYDHWMLDEFQDTSRGQWRVIQNLCDEAIQDTEGTRSFFAVGDEKQSIFTWRGAEPGLFREIMEHYRGRIAERPLAKSQRSGPSVIAMVNRLCGGKARLAELPGLQTASERWPWKEHTSAHLNRTGCAALLEVPVDKDAEDKDEAVWGVCAKWLGEMQPLRRGFTVAVICHRNDRAAQIADFLRGRTGMEVVCESDVSIAEDNPACTALLALLKAAAHPGDEFSWQHINMCPLGPLIARNWPGEGPTEAARRKSRRAPFTLAVLGHIASAGFEKTLRHWIARLLAAQPGLDSFSIARMEELCRAAQTFDAGGSRDTDEFLDFAASWTVRESSHPGAVQVMTLHKSKGLTFDIVLLADLHDSHMYKHSHSIGISRGPQREIEWLTLLPAKDIAQAEPVIAETLTEMEDQQWRERLAQLYVAVTRAARANYLLVPPASRESESLTLPRLLRHMLATENPGTVTFGGRDCPLLSLDGDLTWIESVPLKKDPRTAPVIQADFFSLTSPAAEKPAARVQPSARKWSGHRYLQRRAARRFGTLVHELLARVEWAGPSAEQQLSAWFGRTCPQPEAWQSEALTTALRSLRSEAFAPRAGAEVWRERAYEVITGGEYISGIFDRAIIQRDPAGRLTAAHLYEFKTDRDIEDDATYIARHRAQTTHYRAALQQLTSLPAAAVRAFLLLVCAQPTPRLIEIPA